MVYFNDERRPISWCCSCTLPLRPLGIKMSSPIPSPAPGQCSSRIGPKGVANVTVVAVLAAIYIPIVVLRLYTRQVILKALWWDDYTIVLAMVSGSSSLTFSIFKVSAKRAG